jgi:hypothetical protein
VNCKRKFNRTKRHLLYMVRDPKRFTFNRSAVSTQSDRQKKYNDKRANPEGKILDDVWVIPRVAGMHRERIKGVPTRSFPWSCSVGSWAAVPILAIL